MPEIDEVKQIEQPTNSIGSVDIVKICYEKGLFNRMNCIGRENAKTIDIYGLDKDRLIGYFDKIKEFNREDNNDAGVNSVEFISNTLDIEIFDTFVKVYRIPQHESVSVVEENKSYEFIELPEFTRRWKNFGMTDEDMKNLQSELMTGKKGVALGSGVYKIRFSPKHINKGKNTSHRVFYIEYIADSRIYFVTVISKSEDANITNTELNTIKSLANEIK